MIWPAIIFVAAVVAFAARAHRGLHMLQLDGYRVERYLRHSWENRGTRMSVVPTAATVTAVVVVIAGGIVPGAAGVAAAVLASLGAAILGVSEWRRPVKKALVWTARSKRIATVTAALGAVALAAIHLIILAVGAEPPVAAYLAAVIVVMFAPLFPVRATALLEPVERRIRLGFVRQAEERLASVAPIVVGVAGSFGKTTTKSALAAVLSAKYRAYATPESYNTLLGVTRAINEELADDTQVFVVEMGARQPGDIDEICRVVKPRVGVVTSLGAQHLEYFKTIDTVIRTKTELLRSLPDDGLAVVDADGVTPFDEPFEWDARTLRVSVRADAAAEVLVSDVSVSREGTRFTIRTKDGELVTLSTRLLGRHAAANCALAAVVGLELGLTPDEVRSGLATMKPVPHRLEIVRSDSVTVIDDAFNSNPEGFAAALEVLGSFPGRRILVTPGMVELGSETVPAHIRVAKIAARSCDIVILVGRNAPPEFASTLAETGLAAEALIRAADLAQATAMIGAMVRAGDVVLFENDLPDNFG